MSHEILSAGDLESPIPWEAAPIFRTFVRTVPADRLRARWDLACDRMHYVTSDGLEIPWVDSDRYEGCLIVSWGYAARFPSGRVESYAWGVGEQAPPPWIEGRAPENLRVVVAPAGYPVPRVVMTAEELKRCALGLPHPPFEGGAHGPPKWIP